VRQRLRHPKHVKLTFCGAAGEVTGSCFLVESGSRRFLVDCGLFQGGRETRRRNLEPFAFDPGSIEFVLLTHAHLDHSGLLPRLSAMGFKGPIYTTQATRDLLEVLLPDSAHLQQMEQERAVRLGRDFVAAYSVAQARAVLQQIRPVSYDQAFDPAPGVRARLRDAGHILGSAIIESWLTNAGHTCKLVVSGDLGQPGRPIVRNPTPIDHADVLLVESTYGNRDHKPLDRTLDELVTSLDRALIQRRGMVLVPAFAVGRTQEFLYYLNQLVREHRLKDLTVFVDSPMATEVTRITANHFGIFNAEARAIAQQAQPWADSIRIRFTEDVADSMALNRIESGAIIVAASGMCDGGRIRHHLRHRLANPRTTILIIGFQAAGTLGRRLVDRPPFVRIFGEEIPVRAEIVTLGGFSAHADQSALLAWLRGFRAAPGAVHLVHGEPEAAAAFAARITRELNWKPHIPARGETVLLRP